MLLDQPPEPWLSFFNDLDQKLAEVTDLHCIGGFAVVHAYGMKRSTADVDVLSVVPHANVELLLDAAGKESRLRTRHGIYLDIVGVASAPEDYASRLIPLFRGRWTLLRLFVLEAHDLALTKLERNFERDRGDIEHLARSGFINASVLRQRYFDEMRSYVIGRVSWHDQTLEMWIEAFLPKG
jgi:hypothetical protein